MAGGTVHNTAFPVEEEYAGKLPLGEEPMLLAWLGRAREHLRRIARGLNVTASGLFTIKPYRVAVSPAQTIDTATVTAVTGSTLTITSDLPSYAMIWYDINYIEVVAIGGAEFVRGVLKVDGTELGESIDRAADPTRDSVDGFAQWAGPWDAKTTHTITANISITNRATASIQVVSANLMVLILPRVPGG